MWYIPLRKIGSFESQKGNLFITHPNNYFDQSFKWRNKQHPLQTGVKEEKETYSSQVSSQAYRFGTIWSRDYDIFISVNLIGRMKRQQQNVKKITSLKKTMKVF